MFVAISVPSVVLFKLELEIMVCGDKAGEITVFSVDETGKIMLFSVDKDDTFSIKFRSEIFLPLAPKLEHLLKYDCIFVDCSIIFLCFANYSLAS